MSKLLDDVALAEQQWLSTTKTRIPSYLRTIRALAEAGEMLYERVDDFHDHDPDVPSVKKWRELQEKGIE